jgi:hypothetical protein
MAYFSAFHAPLDAPLAHLSRAQSNAPFVRLPSPSTFIYQEQPVFNIVQVELTGDMITMET